MVSHHPTNFGGPKDCSDGDIKVLICHVNSGLSNFICGSKLNVSHHPAKAGGRRCSGSGDLMVFLCHVILKDRMIKASYDFIWVENFQSQTIWWP